MTGPSRRGRVLATTIRSSSRADVGAKVRGVDMARSKHAPGCSGRLAVTWYAVCAAYQVSGVARWAELVFCTPHSKADTLAFTTDLKARMAAHGRAPDACKVLPSFMTVIGETEAIAQEKLAYLQSLIDPEAQQMLNSSLMGADLTKHQDVQSFAAAQGNQGISGSTDRVMQVMQQDGITFTQATQKPRGVLVGTAQSVADQLEDYFTSGACDGFIITPTVHPRMFEEFGRLVVPELQRRGLVRKEYAGATLRENLARP